MFGRHTTPPSTHPSVICASSPRQTLRRRLMATHRKANGSKRPAISKERPPSDGLHKLKLTVYSLLGFLAAFYLTLSNGPDQQLSFFASFVGPPRQVSAVGIGEPKDNTLSPIDASEVPAVLLVNDTQQTPEATTTREVIKLQRPKQRRVLGHKHMLDAHIKEGCDMDNDSYEDCARSKESLMILQAYGQRQRLTFICFIVVTLMMVMLIQWIIRVSTEGVARSRDKNLKIYEETVFKQIACVLMVVAVLEIFLQSHLLGVPLEQRLFGKLNSLFPNHDMLHHFSHVELVLDYLLCITLTFACCFLVMAVFLAFCGYKINRWLRYGDAVDVQNASLKVEGNKSAVEFLTLRYEFEDAVQQSCVPGLDPPGLYFQNYCRACTYRVASELLLVPPSTLILAFSCVLLCFAFPISSIVHKTEVIVMICLAAAPLVCLLLAYSSVLLTKRKLLPRDMYMYLTVRLAWDLGNSTDSLLIGNADAITPPYRQQKNSKSTCLPESLARLFYGTRYPNNHESLFFFWRRGPGLLIQCCQISIFAGLVVLAFTLTAVDAHQDVWLKACWPWGILIVVTLCLLQLAVIPSLLWNLVVVTCTSGLIKDPVLQEVWETQRARTVQRFRVLIDCLRCEANLLRIERGGRQLRDTWNDRAQFDDPINSRNDDAAFKRLDPDSKGLVTREHLFRHLVAEGLTLRYEKDAQRWITAFDRKNKGGLDREDFGVLAWNVRTLMNTELDLDSVATLFAEKFSLPLDGKIDVQILGAVFDKWGLQWTKVHIMHLFQYMTGRRGAQPMNVKVFIHSLRGLESNTIGMLRQAVGDLTMRSDSSLDSSRSDEGLHASTLIMRNYSRQQN